MVKIKALLNYLHSRGIAIPLIRYQGQGSFSATVFWIATTIVMIGFLANLVVFVDNTYITCKEVKYFPMAELLAWFGTCCVPYLMRNNTSTKDPGAPKSEEPKLD